MSPNDIPLATRTGLLYYLRLVSDPHHGGFRARLSSDGIGTIMEPHDETKVGAVLRLVRELRSMGSSHDKDLADAIDRLLDKSLKAALS
jgi:hypothetical protein